MVQWIVEGKNLYLALQSGIIFTISQSVLRLLPRKTHVFWERSPFSSQLKSIEILILQRKKHSSPKALQQHWQTLSTLHIKFDSEDCFFSGNSFFLCALHWWELHVAHWLVWQHQRFVSKHLWHLFLPEGLQWITNYTHQLCLAGEGWQRVESKCNAAEKLKPPPQNKNKNWKKKRPAEETTRWELIAWVLPMMSKIFQVCHISFSPLYRPKILPRALPKPSFHLYMYITSAGDKITHFFCVDPSTTALLLWWSTAVTTMRVMDGANGTPWEIRGQRLAVGHLLARRRKWRGHEGAWSSKLKWKGKWNTEER